VRWRIPLAIVASLLFAACCDLSGGYKVVQLWFAVASLLSMLAAAACVFSEVFGEPFHGGTGK